MAVLSGATAAPGATLFKLLFAISLGLHSLLREDRRRLGYANKIGLLFAISLGLHYLCKVFANCILNEN